MEESKNNIEENNINNEESSLDEDNVNNMNQEFATENDINNDLENPIIKEEISNFRFSLLYGNNINDLKPKMI